MHELPWITIFRSRVRRFVNDFNEWRSHEWKSLVNRITSDSKIVTHGNECIILFLTRYFMFLTHNFSKNNQRSLISQLSPRTVFSDLALWRHHSWSVTSRERQIVALCRHIRRLFLHAQIGTKAIFCSERTRGAGFRSVNPAERWRENPARALARAGFSLHLECGINRSESSPDGSFALIPHPVARWAKTTP